MKDKHIIDLIESKSVSALSESELAAIDGHVDECTDCQKAYKAAFIAGVLLKERASVTVEPPSPFFHTRVLATLRERQAASEIWGLSKLWRTAGSLASLMVATVVALAILTFTLPDVQAPAGSRDLASSLNASSAEEVILGPDETTKDQLSDSQVLTTLYDEEDVVR